MDKEDQRQNTTNKQPRSGCDMNAKIEDDFIMIDLAGEIDLGSSSKIYSLILQQSKQNNNPLIINLEKVVFMDSSGLQILLRLREKLQFSRRHILLVNPEPQIRKLFQLTGFDKMFHVFENQDQALAFIKYEAGQNNQ